MLHLQPQLEIDKFKFRKEEKDEQCYFSRKIN